MAMRAAASTFRRAGSRSAGSAIGAQYRSVWMMSTSRVPGRARSKSISAYGRRPSGPGLEDDVLQIHVAVADDVRWAVNKPGHLAIPLRARGRVEAGDRLVIAELHSARETSVESAVMNLGSGRLVTTPGR